MARAPAHKFGQIIGRVLEDTVEPYLIQIANEHNLYLDKKGSRRARKGKIFEDLLPTLLLGLRE